MARPIRRGSVGIPDVQYSGAVGLFESIADRRIQEARRAGLFDNLPGAGKPIADLGRERPPGWWASRVVTAERDQLRYEELDGQIKRAKPTLWRLDSEELLRAAVHDLNEQIIAYNTRTTFQQHDALDPQDVVRTWRDVRRLSDG